MLNPDEFKKISTPFANNEHLLLRAGEMVLLSGVVFCVRDAAHRRFCEALAAGKQLPIALAGQTIFYAAPTPNRADGSVGVIGPTTSRRMDAFTPTLLQETGLMGMIGKGNRSAEVRQAISAQRAIYLGAIGGVAALTRRCIRKASVAAYADLATEAVLRLEVENLPLLVLINADGEAFAPTAKPS